MRGRSGRSIVPSVTRRCYLVYACAPSGTSARAANQRLNRYVEERDRGIAVFHDHFTGKPHGGFVVLDIQTEDELARLDDLGPLEGWTVTVHPLTFSLTAVGFASQAELTLDAYRDTSFEELRASEPRDRRFWWQAA
jgi:hypothetical protein